MAVGNVLETEIDCDGSPMTVSTVRDPGESLSDFIDRHEEDVKAAKADCSGGGSDSPLTFNTTWNTASATITYRSPGSYGQAAHDADVDTLKDGPYPPA